MRSVEPWKNTKPGPAGAAHDFLIAVVKKPDLSAKLVDKKARYHSGIFGINHCLGSDNLRNDPAPVDITRQDHRHPRCAGKPHVSDVAVPQIGFGRASRTFDDDQVGGFAQNRETL